MAINNFEQVARSVLQTADPITGADGRLYLDGTMTQAVMAQAIAEPIFIGEIFRDGQSVTKKYAVGAKPGDAIRVPLPTPFPRSSRTLALGNRRGTKGNGGIINTNPPMMSSDDEFTIFLNQVNDQSILFPDMQKQLMPFYTVAQKLASYAKTVVEDRSASQLAEIIAYNAYRSLNGADNINNLDISADGAYGDLVNDLHTKLDNGDMLTHAHAYSTTGRTIIGRPSFINRAFNRKSGVLLTGGDLAQSMLKDYAWDKNLAERDYVGNSYKGTAMNFEWIVAADYIWTLAEQYLELDKGSLDHVLAIAVSYEANAASDNVDLSVKLIDTDTVRGLKAQPLNCWGHESFRKSLLIGDATLSNDLLKQIGFEESVRIWPVSPCDLTDKSDQILVPVYAADGVTITGYMPIVNVTKPNGGSMQSGQKQAEPDTQAE